jgi:hypothetical protein
VLKYDAWIPNLNDWVTLATNSNLTDPTFQANSILGLCALTQLRCTGPNQQWPDLGACIDGLSALPYGDYDEAWGDNIVCRSIHIVLTQIRPDVSLPLPAETCAQRDEVGADRGSNDRCIACTSARRAAASASTSPTRTSTSRTRPFSASRWARPSCAHES